MRLRVEELCPRETPAFLASAGGTVVVEGVGSFSPYGPTDIPLSVAQGPDVTGDGVGDIVVGAGAGGGPVVTLVDGVSLATVAQKFVLPESFRGGISVGADDRFVYAGAGPGGGPVLVTLDAGLNPVSTRFVGPQDNRSGVLLSGYAGRPPAPGVAETPVLSDLASKGVFVNGDGVATAQLEQVRAGLGRLSPAFFRDFGAVGGRVDLIAGRPVTTHPEFADLAGVTNYVLGEPYDNAAGLASVRRPLAVARTDVGEPDRIATHELGHLVARYVLGGADYGPDWGAAFAASGFTGRLADRGEAWAESFADFVLGRPLPQPAAAYFVGLFRVRGW